MATDDPWHGLQRFTPARIALGRAGSSLPTRVNLAFQLDHARARDAVYAALDETALRKGLGELFGPARVVHSRALDRAQYLQRPDLGRQLTEADWQRLADTPAGAFDLVPVLLDGLSASAVNRHALPLLRALLAEVAASAAPLRFAAPVVVRQGRVAVADDVGEALRAPLTLVLVGERPGLSSPDSLGLYLTYQPRRGCVDAQRNCISNIRPQGLSYEAAAQTCCYLIQRALQKGLTGTGLKDLSCQRDAEPGSAIPFLR